MHTATSIDWRSWSTEAFSRAHATRRPILLAIGATWSAACRAMDRDVFADARVAALLRDRVVALRVDADRRPDIADRYGAGGWPTTMFLTADGDPLCGGTYVDADRLAALIVDVADRCQRDYEGIRRLALEARRARQAANAGTSPSPPRPPSPSPFVTWERERGEGRRAFEAPHARGEGRTASEAPHARGEGRTASEAPHARGERRTASEASHARGEGRTASEASHARGEGRTASEAPHARGEGRTASEAPGATGATADAAHGSAGTPHAGRFALERHDRVRLETEAAAIGDDDVERSALERIGACLLAEYDAAHGGFGDREKFPLVAPIAFALRYGHRTGEEALVDLAITTLDRMGWGGLSDGAAVDDSTDASARADAGDRADSSVRAAASVGGDASARHASARRDAGAGAFHRACARADWTEPDRAHLLDLHADLIRLYLDAWTLTGFERYRERAVAAWTYVDRVLHDRAHGGFFASEADGAIDRILLTDANAKMIRALLHMSRVLDEPRHAECAARAAERLVPAVYGRGAGVAHLLDAQSQSRVRGLLTDQVHASAALLDLGLAAGDRTYLDLADELMRSCLRKLWDADAGAFVDRLRSSAGAGDVGLLAEPLRPFALNAEAARLLDRLGRHTGHAEFAARAADLRAWLARNAPLYGVLAAEYGLVTLVDD